MALLLHEIWEEADESGEVLHTCCLAGSLGDGCHSLLSSKARLLTTFIAGSHFEAMTIYHSFIGHEAYSTVHTQDHDPYPDAWRDKQHKEKICELGSE